MTSQTQTKAVAIYTTPTCVYCKKAKAYFQENDIKYDEFNVAEDAEKRTEMIEMTGQLGVPVITVGDDIIVGFNEAHVAELLHS